MAKVAPGTIVGDKYRLEEPIGQGGMASVWRATHTTLGSSVAVKFLDGYGSSRQVQAERFLREAQIAARLEHRNVVRILDFGVLGDEDQPYMAMELLSGQSLADRLEGDAPPDEAELLEIVAQLLGGLAAVHDAGIVHRDVKPDNVFLVKDSDGIYPKLLDFGISKSDGAARMTDTGAVVGTPVYMSPEQARGHKDLDPRTDLFSVGMILYEALSGSIPFESEHMGEILIRVATEDVPPLEGARPDLPKAVVDVVMKALARDRAARWKDARAMRSALLSAADELVHGGAGGRPRTLPSQRHASKTGPGLRSAPPARRRSLIWIVAGTALLAAALGFAGVIASLGPSEAAPPEAAPTTAPPAEPPPPAPEVVVEAPPVPEEVAPTVAASPPIVEEEDPAPRAAPARRGRGRATARDPAPPASAEDPDPPPSRRRGRAEGASPGGGFLRDLDY